MPITKPFVIATEGQTIDGRNISREQIQQMAANYDPKVYTAVASLEHLLSYSPDSLFSAYGKVVKLGTQEADILGDKKLQLTAIVDASESVVAMQKDGKKAFASIEIAANFLNKGFAYLSGLAFTDIPASVGTESMKFSASKQHIYSFKDEIEVEFEKEQAKPSEGDNLFGKVMKLLGLKDKSDDARFTDIGQAVEAIATSQKSALDQIAEFSSLRTELDTLKKADEVRTAEFNRLKEEVEKLSAQPNGQGNRPPATGGQDKEKTDC